MFENTLQMFVFLLQYQCLSTNTQMVASALQCNLRGGGKKNDERPKSKFWTIFDLILNDCT